MLSGKGYLVTIMLLVMQRTSGPGYSFAPPYILRSICQRLTIDSRVLQDFYLQLRAVLVDTKKGCESVRGKPGTFPCGYTH